MPEDATIAGVACSQVLAHLSDFVDGALDDAQVHALEGHLAACRHCARFGAEFGAVLGRLRGQLGGAQKDERSLGAELAVRLEARLDGLEPGQG
ncbi:MAG: zf-HC2 domain-containing protein [Nannocystaceae bacterium]|nr:zf-HC2 domain-containing protein [Nannocystaceae bacterium]